MKIIAPKVKRIADFEGIDCFFHAVGRAAKICYKTDDIVFDEVVVKRLIQLKHYSPFAHSIIYLSLSNLPTDVSAQWSLLQRIIYNKFTIRKDDYAIVNGRVIIEEIVKNKDENVNTYLLLKDFLNYLKQFEYDFKRKPKEFFSFIVDTSIGCTREMNRHHDNFYVCEQSTRFCNFSKARFGSQVTFNKPYWQLDGNKNIMMTKIWKDQMQAAEKAYMTALEYGTTDQARGLLPLDTHTKAIYTASLDEWMHFIELRSTGTTGKPHGDIKFVADKIKDYFFNL